MRGVRYFHRLCFKLEIKSIMLSLYAVRFCFQDSALDINNIKAKISVTYDKATKGNKVNFMKYKPSVSREMLFSILQQCSTVEEQIKKMHQTLCLTKEEVLERRDLRVDLENTFRIYFPECCVHLVGSSISGFGVKGCDVDLSLFMDWESLKTEIQNNNLPKVPVMEDIINGKSPISSVAFLSKKRQLRFLGNILEQHCADCHEPVVLGGRCPILQFQYGPMCFNCDLSINNRSAVETTKLLLFLGKLDERVIPLTMIINYWAKCTHLVGGRVKFKSYAILLLVTYFLQTRDPPILPAIQQLFDTCEYFRNNSLWDCTVKISDVELFRSKNVQSLEELLKEFFCFYLCFDFSKVICPLTGDCIDKKDMGKKLKSSDQKFEFTTICIQDPSRLYWNVNTELSYLSCLQFRKQLLFTCKMYEDDTLWLPNVNNWGIALLFKNYKSENVNNSFPVHRKHLENIEGSQL